MKSLCQCLCGFAACAADVMAEWYLLQEGGNVGWFDYFQMFQMFIRRIALQANDGLRRVENGYAFCFAERDDFVAVEYFLYLKMGLVTIKNLSQDPPSCAFSGRNDRNG